MTEFSNVRLYTAAHPVELKERYVVTKDIPENSLAVGNPCRVIRRINVAVPHSTLHAPQST